MASSLIGFRRLKDSVNQSNSPQWPHPSDFPVGSDESRAAARAMLESEILFHVIVENIGSPDKTEEIIVWKQSDRGNSR